MRVAIRKWGNSLALRLPSALMKDVEFVDGTEVDVRLDGNRLVVTKAAARLTLEQLLASVTPDNLHAEESTGAPQGRGGW